MTDIETITAYEAIDELNKMMSELRAQLEIQKSMVLKYQTALAKAEQERDVALARLHDATNSAFDSGAKAAALEESHRFVAMLKERDSALKSAADLERILLNEGNPESSAVRQVAAALRERNQARNTLRMARQALSESGSPFAEHQQKVLDVIARIEEVLGDG